MDKVIFHIGSPKTGTSIIQSHLSQNRAILRDKGVLYPLTISSDETLYRTFDSHHLLVYSWADWSPFNKYNPDTFFSLVRKEEKNYKFRHLLLSAENAFWLPTKIIQASSMSEDEYWSRKLEFIRRISADLNFCETEIVVYLRRQDRWLESWYNQQVKNGNAISPDMVEFSHQQRFLLDYETQLDLWESVFGEGSIKVRVYEKEQLTQGLLNDFLQALGLGDEHEFPLRQKPRHNAQFTRDALEFMNLCNTLNLDPDVAYRLRGAVRKITNQLDSQLLYNEQSLFSPDERRTVVEDYADMNSRIANKYLPAASDKLFTESIPNDDESWTSYAGLDYKVYVPLLVHLITELNNSSPVKTGRQGHIRQVFARMAGVLKASGVASASMESYRFLKDERLWQDNIWS